jgi:hypothetical protein
MKSRMIGVSPSQKGFSTMAGFITAPEVSVIVRHGSKVTIPAPLMGQPATLPPLCVKCGNPADGKPVEKTFYWHNPAIYLTILLGALVYVVVAMVVRKRIRVRVPLCAQHAQRRGTFVMLACVLPLIGIADAVILPQFDVDGGLVALLAVALVLAGIIIWASVANPIRPTFIDQSHGDFTGFNSAFLQKIPEGLQPPAPAFGQASPPPPAVVS